jgi:hypothetical protein
LLRKTDFQLAARQPFLIDGKQDVGTFDYCGPGVMAVPDTQYFHVPLSLS